MKSSPAAGIPSATASTAGDIALNIMCHPSRLQMAEELAATIGPDVRIVLDPEPDEPADAVRCAAEAWSSAGAGQSHVLVLQDDISVVPDFLPRLVEAVGRFPDDVIALFAAWSSATSGAARLAVLNGYAWLDWRAEYVPVPALVIPTEIARELSAFLRLSTDRSRGDAGLLQDFLSLRGQRSLLQLPSLAEHDVRGAESVLGNSFSKGVRRSVCFAGDAGPGEAALRQEVYETCEAPFVSQYDFKAYVNVKSTSSEDLLGVDVTAENWLSARGADPGRLSEGWVATATTIAPRLREVLRMERLQQAWLSAVCLGTLSAGTRGDAVTAAGDAALATTIPGIFRRVFPDELLNQIADLSLPMLRAGFRLGQQIAG